MKKSILFLSLLLSGNALANNVCYGVIPEGPIDTLETPTIEVLGNGNIYANGNMQAELAVNYKALDSFSFTDITFCDLGTMLPIEHTEEWKVDAEGNQYLHEILPAQASTNRSNTDENIVINNEWTWFHETRFLRKANNIPASAEVCVVITGNQTNMEGEQEVISKTSCIGDSTSSVHIIAQEPEPIGFELQQKKFTDKKEHLGKVYELHTQSEHVQIHDIKYSSTAIEATESPFRVISNSAFNVLRDYQGGNTSSWVGVWAYDSKKVDKVEVINENSHTIGTLSLPTITPPSTPSLITSFFLYQIHNHHYMIEDALCSKAHDGRNLCVDYKGNDIYKKGESDRLTNHITITDFYGTTHSLTAKFGTGNDNDDLFIY